MKGGCRCEGSRAEDDLPHALSRFYVLMGASDLGEGKADMWLLLKRRVEREELREGFMKQLVTMKEEAQIEGHHAPVIAGH